MLGNLFRSGSAPAMCLYMYIKIAEVPLEQHLQDTNEIRYLEVTPVDRMYVSFGGNQQAATTGCPVHTQGG